MLSIGAASLTQSMWTMLLTFQILKWPARATDLFGLPCACPNSHKEVAPNREHPFHNQVQHSRQNGPPQPRAGHPSLAEAAPRNAGRGGLAPTPRTRRPTPDLPGVPRTTAGCCWPWPPSVPFTSTPTTGITPPAWRSTPGTLSWGIRRAHSRLWVHVPVAVGSGMPLTVLGCPL